MADRFNWDKIKGAEALNLGEGLLNEVSKGNSIDRIEIEYLKAEWIRPNPKNKMSMNDIDELAQQIKLAGLKQPLTVRRVNDESYVLITGHRRFEAIKRLMAKKDWKGEYVPCIIEDPSKLDLPINNDLKENISILTTNQQRNKTDADLIYESRMWHEIYAELRKAGVETFILGEKENGEKVVQQIKGVPTRNLVAEAIGTSPAQVAKIKKVDEQGSSKLIESIESGKTSIASAEKIASLSKEEQDRFIDTMLEKNSDSQIKARDLEVYQKNKVGKKKQNEEQEIASVMIDRVDLKKDLKEIQELLRVEGLCLDSTEYKSYSNYIEKIRKLLQKAAERA